MEEFLKSVPGAEELFAWFGYWPAFQAAEVISLVLIRSGPSTLGLRTWHTTGQVDDGGCSIKDKHVVVNFKMEEILSVAFSNFSNQSVISGLEILLDKNCYRLNLDPSYGLAGSISARMLSIEIEPAAEGLI